MSAFITVGSTGFDDLINETTSTAFLTSLSSIGIKRVCFQYGASESIFIKNLQSYDDKGPILAIDGYKYKPSITEDMEKADIIISHAGAGTVLQALRLENKKLIIVINESLMDNHQLELAKALTVKNYAICSEISELSNTLKNIKQINLVPFPSPKPETFATIVDEQMGFITTQ
ncbi:UDP-N-acetylglucosamine transferase subunit ALG13 [Cokeromyces recurvatus]|uniref:UDP-N-acetylglucosamine transferase subunit ALG13 n=1 Tax=Cokeromyces recurvatus TaxID=90255 RepID=UPI0022200B67|nr:UDP-N-acetylglucosamine transferase subunit ALG13 [Cokeromyces recurvatus]KAI7904420.1 UDP-N-acetylglucosamine transferase subunit ALG13 [Cokeromyces recurvatus]